MTSSCIRTKLAVAEQAKLLFYYIRGGGPEITGSELDPPLVSFPRHRVQLTASRLLLLLCEKVLAFNETLPASLLFELIGLARFRFSQQH